MCFSYKSKKKLRNYVIGLFFLLGGIEYGVILPTLWLFLQHTFYANEAFYSIVLSSYSFASLVSSPLFGASMDFCVKSKLLLITGIFFEIGGNFLYFAAPTKYLVLTGRLLCGVGDGVGSILFAQIVRTSTVEERVTALSMAMGARQIGFVIGPALNFALKQCNFHIGPFLVNNYRSPGILMAIIWTLAQLLVITCYYDLPNDDVSDIESTFNESINNVNISDQVRVVLPAIKRRPSSISETISLWKELLHEVVLVILMAQFIMFFNICALEALLAPMMEHLLGWKEASNSSLYSLAGVEAIIVFILVSKLSKRIEDKWLMVIGLVMETLAIVLYLVVLAHAKPYDSTILPTVCVGTFLIIFGLPFLGVGGTSLFSKITSKKTQGFLQGVRRSFLQIATIIGALWGGSLFRRLYILISVTLGLIVIVEVMMFLSFDRMNAPVKKPVPSEETEEERQPLLS